VCAVKRQQRVIGKERREDIGYEEGEDGNVKPRPHEDDAAVPHDEPEDHGCEDICERVT
jgi:hypothetical protein